MTLGLPCPVDGDESWRVMFQTLNSGPTEKDKLSVADQLVKHDLEDFANINSPADL